MILEKGPVPCINGDGRIALVAIVVLIDELLYILCKTSHDVCSLHKGTPESIAWIAELNTQL